MTFADGSHVAADVLLCCTGYELQFPFLSPTLLEATHGRVDLYHHIFPAHLPDLAFVGLAAMATSHPLVAEMQARWVSHVFSGAEALPSSAEMEASIQRQRLHPISQNPVPLWAQVPCYTDEIARILGVYPHPWRHLRHVSKLLMGPMSADDYRLERPKRSK